MFQSFQPPSSKNFSVAEEESSLAFLVAISVLSFITIAIGPGKNPVASYESICPLSFIHSSIRIGKSALSVESASSELPFIDSRFANVVSVTLFVAFDVVSFIVRSVLEFFFAISMNHIIFPLSRILIVLKRIAVCSISACNVVLNLTFVYASVVKNVATLSLSNTFAESALVVRTVFEEELTLAVKFIVGPLAVVKTFWTVYLFVTFAV